MIMSEAEKSPSIHHLVSGQGPYVTLVHGVGANLKSWDEVEAGESNPRSAAWVRRAARAGGRRS